MLREVTVAYYPRAAGSGIFAAATCPGCGHAVFFFHRLNSARVTSPALEIQFQNELACT
jgi:hypothetical protein